MGKRNIVCPMSIQDHNAHRNLRDPALAYIRGRSCCPYKGRGSNSKVQKKEFSEGSLVLRNVFQNTKVLGAGVQRPNQEAPYKVCQVIHDKTYLLEEMNGAAINHPWNTDESTSASSHSILLKYFQSRLYAKVFVIQSQMPINKDTFCFQNTTSIITLCLICPNFS